MVLPQKDTIYMILRPLQKLGGDSPLVPTTNLMRISHPARMKTNFLSKLRFFFFLFSILSSTWSPERFSFFDFSMRKEVLNIDRLNFRNDSPIFSWTSFLLYLLKNMAVLSLFIFWPNASSYSCRILLVPLLLN